MPFITEELWGELKERSNSERLIVAAWPKAGKANSAALQHGEHAFQCITEIRNLRNSKGISPKESLTLLRKEEQPLMGDFWPVISKLANLKEVKLTNKKVNGAAGFMIKSSEFFVPMEGKLDVAKERELIMKELEYQKGFLASVEKKLSNEKFVANAKPEVIEIERKKKADAETKIKALEESLKNL